MFHGDKKRFNYSIVTLLGPAVHGMGAPKGIQLLIHNNACIQSNENVAECSLCVQIFVAECSSVATV